MKKIIHSDDAPKAIGPYSQAIQMGNTIYLSGQIPLDPKTMDLVSNDFKEQAKQVFVNIQSVSLAAGGSLESIVKLTIYVTDLTKFPLLNETMQEFFKDPFPARTTIEVSALPKGSQVEIEAVMVL